MGDAAQVLVVTPEMLPQVWPEVVRLLDKSVETSNGKFHIEDLWAEIMNGALVLWVVCKNEQLVACYTTRLVVYPNRRALAVDWLGGTGVFSWLGAVQTAVEGHARHNACAHIEGYGRQGWGRLLARYGWKPEYVAYRMELSDGQG